MLHKSKSDQYPYIVTHIAGRRLQSHLLDGRVVPMHQVLLDLTCVRKGPLDVLINGLEPIRRQGRSRQHCENVRGV